MSSTGIELQGFLPFVIIDIKLDRFDGLPRDGVTLLACIRPFDTSRENQACHIDCYVCDKAAKH